ncbi:MAG: hypothetical protein IID31_00395 [Planctomycetes bacterium]|nr:hypothetical protein [Planctomycetota bacterium]
MSDKPIILVLESSDANPASMLNAESAALQSVGAVLDFDVEVVEITSADDFKRAACTFNSQGFCVLYVVAHGDSHGLRLADGSFVDWKAFVNSFDFKHPDLTSLVLSSCSCLDGDALVEALQSSSLVTPKNVFGFKQLLKYEDAIPSGVLLLRALPANNSSDVAASLAAMYLALKVDMWYYVRNSNGDYDYVRGSQILDSICDPQKEKLGWRKGLLEDRGIFPVEAIN